MNPRSLGVACVLVALLLSGCATGPESSRPALPAAANALDHPVNLADTDVQPVAAVRVAPEYPPSLRKANVTGEALIDFIVDTDGEVVRVKVIRATHALFGEAAKDAAQQWRFRPAQKGGLRVACHMQVPVVFTLNDEVAEQAALPSPDESATSGIDDAIDVGQVDVKPVARLRVAPQYPIALREAGVTGSAVIEFIVNTEGVVARTNVVRATNAEFGEAAKAAVQKWRFRPAQKGGNPVACRMQVPIVFTLNDRRHG